MGPSAIAGVGVSTLFVDETGVTTTVCDQQGAPRAFTDGHCVK
jgi:hypothetical protein